MYWSHNYIRDGNKTVYTDFICKKCNESPAISVEYDDAAEGPYCFYHWVDFILSKFKEIK